MSPRRPTLVRMGWEGSGRRRHRRRARRPVPAAAIALCALLTCAVLASCSGSDGVSRPTSPSSASTTARAADRAPVGPPSTVEPPTGATITQPAQRTSGFGSSDLGHAGVRESSGGTGADAWYAFEPTDPRPRSAPVVVVLHGYYEYAGHASMDELIRHTVLGGSIVVYPRWQTGVAQPCPGPFDVDPCLRSAVAGVDGALASLRADPDRVQPDLDHVSWFGFSFGGIVTIDLANRWRELGLPEPRAIFLDDPHDGGLDGKDEPAVDRPLTGVPAGVRLVCHVGAEGVTAEAGSADGSCNSIFPLLTTVPASHKTLVLTRPDAHGSPPLSSRHGVCSVRSGHADAYDWNFCWKVWDALRAAATAGTTLVDELGGLGALRSNGDWSDGTPIAPLVVADEAPIRP